MATNSQGNSVSKTVSMDVKMGEDSEERAENLGFRSYSAYIQSLVREDLRARNDIVLSESNRANSSPNSTSPGHTAALQLVETDSSRLKTSSSSLGKKLAEANFERKLTKYERRAALKKPKSKRKTGRIHRS